jgi:hypothetical protein
LAGLKYSSSLVWLLKEYEGHLRILDRELEEYISERPSQKGTDGSLIFPTRIGGFSWWDRGTSPFQQHPDWVEDALTFSQSIREVYDGHGGAVIVPFSRKCPMVEHLLLSLR